MSEVLRAYRMFFRAFLIVALIGSLWEHHHDIPSNAHVFHILFLILACVLIALDFLCPTPDPKP